MSSSGTFNEEGLDERASKKEVRGELEDRISWLPDEIKTDIVSLMPMRRALKMCMLSNNWRRIIASLPKLEFIETEFPEIDNRGHRVANLIDWTLSNRDESDVSTMIIKFDLSEKSCPLMNNEWVTFAVRHNVKKLLLMVKFDHSVGLPICLFECNSLVVLKLFSPNQVLEIRDSIFLPNLKKLVLQGVGILNDKSMELLFSGCPMLEVFRIIECCMYHIRKFTIFSTTLRILQISNCWGIDRCHVCLDVPCIEDLFYKGILARKYEFGKMNHTFKAFLYIVLDPVNGRPISELAPRASGLLRAVCNAKALTMNASFNKIFLEVPNELWHLNRFQNLISLHLHLRATEGSVETFLRLFSYFRRLERLQIFIDRRGIFDIQSEMEWPEDSPLEGVFSHLQYLQIDNFEAYALEMGLLTCFLKSARSLSEAKLMIPNVAFILDGVNTDWRIPEMDGFLRQMVIDKVAIVRRVFPAVPITTMFFRALQPLCTTEVKILVSAVVGQYDGLGWPHGANEKLKLDILATKDSLKSL